MQEVWRLYGASTKVNLMGLLDDLQMGFGLKERTEDYDARTARTIAANEAAGGSNDAMSLAQARNPQHSSFLPVSSSSGAQQYLGSRGYDEGYTPQVAEDDRPFMQRLLFSPESDLSPKPYAIGPLTMDQPLPQFGLLGLLSGLGGMFGRDAPTVAADASPMRVRPVTSVIPSGEAASEALDALPDMTAPSYVPEMQSAPAPREFDINFLENTRVPRAIDLERPLSLLPEDPTYSSGIDVDVPTIPTPDVIQLQNGLYVNRRTGKVFR